MGTLENYAYRRRHLYNLNPVIVDGIRYNVMSVAPIHTEKTPKKVKEILKYLIDGK